MRKLLPSLLILLLLSLTLLAAAASAHALTLPFPAQAIPLVGAEGEESNPGDETEAGDEEGESSEADGEGEGCGTEGDELCEEEGDGCLLEEADPSVVTVPGRYQVRLAIRYHASEPTAVNVDASLRGSKGGLHLGTERVRFHRIGVYRDSFSLGPKQMPKALAAREFVLDLRVVGAPADCELQLSTRGSRRAR
jgi:hypothetical protein